MTAVQMRLDSVDVLTSRSRGLIVVAMAWLVGASSMAYGADIDPLKLPDTQQRIRAYKMEGKTMIDLDSVDEYHASLPRVESRAS